MPLFFLISSGSPHVRPMGAHRTCEEPDGIEFTAIGGGIERLATRTGDGEARARAGSLSAAVLTEGTTGVADETLASITRPSRYCPPMPAHAKDRQHRYVSGWYSS